MVAMLQFAHIDMNGNEIQNVLAQNLASAPSTNVAAGRFYFNTADHTLYVYNGTAWVDALNQGKIYTYQNGLEELTGADAGKVQIKIATGDNAGNVVFTANSNGLKGQVDLSGKVDKNDAITGATKCKITYDAKGLVTSGADLEASDIPNLASSKINAMTGYTKASSAAAIEATDSLNTAIGKLEKTADGKVDANAAITGATKCKITYDAKGLVTSGADLAASDIPNLSLSKITDVTATASEVNVLDGITASTAELNILDGVTATATEINVLDGIEASTAELNIMHGVTADASEINVLDGITASTAELNIMDGVTVTASDINSVTSKIDLTDLSVATGSANYLGYNNTTGEFSAKVDTTVTASSTNLVTSGAVESAISTALVGGVIYKGTWDITSATDFSGITLPVKKGYMYLVTGTGPKTIGGIEWNAGDYLMVNADVAAGGSLTGKVEKIDNTEAADIVRLNATQTLTNKTIDADDNTISDLQTSNFKSGVMQTSVRAVASASDTAIASEKAVASAIANFITASSTDTLTNKTIDGDDNTIQDLALGVFKSGVVVDSTTGIAATSSASDSKIATEKAIAAKLATKVEKFTAQNGALTATSGVCTWSITNSIGSADVQVAIYQVSTGAQVGAYVEVGAATITVKFNSAADIAADTFKAVVIGL